jgi:hypothetical protein
LFSNLLINSNLRLFIMIFFSLSLTKIKGVVSFLSL